LYYSEIMYSTTLSVTDMEVDWLSKNIYWVDYDAVSRRIRLSFFFFRLLRQLADDEVLIMLLQASVFSGFSLML